MKKTFWIIFIVSVLYLAIFILLDLIFGAAVMDWNVLWIIFSIMLFIVFVFHLISRYKYQKIYKSFQLKKFDETLILCKKMLKWNPNLFVRQNVYYIMAIIFFEKNDDLRYESAVKHVEHKKLLPLKLYWQTMTFLIKDNPMEAKMHYQKFLDSLTHIRKREAYATHEGVLKNIFAFIDNKNEETISNLKTAMEKASLNRTKNYIEGLLNK